MTSKTVPLVRSENNDGIGGGLGRFEKVVKPVDRIIEVVFVEFPGIDANFSVEFWLQGGPIRLKSVPNVVFAPMFGHRPVYFSRGTIPNGNRFAIYPFGAKGRVPTGPIFAP